MSSLGRQFNVPTPAIDTMTSLAELVLERDFWSKGATAASLGLDGYSREQIMEYLTNG